MNGLTLKKEAAPRIKSRVALSEGMKGERILQFSGQYIFYRNIWRRMEHTRKQENRIVVGERATAISSAAVLIS